MTSDPVCIAACTPAEEVSSTLRHLDISALPVVDAGGRIIGIITPADLPPHKAGDDRSTADADHHMNRAPVLVPPDLPAAKVASILLTRITRHILVADRNRVPLGIITPLDILRRTPPQAFHTRKSGQEPTSDPHPDLQPATEPRSRTGDTSNRATARRRARSLHAPRPLATLDTPRA